MLKPVGHPSNHVHVTKGSLTWDNADPCSYDSNFVGVLKVIRVFLMDAKIDSIPTLIALAKKVHKELENRIGLYHKRNDTWYNCRYNRFTRSQLFLLRRDLTQRFEGIVKSINLAKIKNNKKVEVANIVEEISLLPPPPLPTAIVGFDIA